MPAGGWQPVPATGQTVSSMGVMRVHQHRRRGEWLLVQLPASTQGRLALPELRRAMAHTWGVVADLQAACGASVGGDQLQGERRACMGKGSVPSPPQVRASEAPCCSAALKAG